MCIVKPIDVFKKMEQKRRHKQAYYIVLDDGNTSASGNMEIDKDSIDGFNEEETFGDDGRAINNT